MRPQEICKHHTCVDVYIMQVMNKLELIRSLWEAFDLECHDIRGTFSSQHLDLIVLDAKIDLVLASVMEAQKRAAA